MLITPHFDRSEFKCKCGKCGRDDVSEDLVKRLENLYDYFSKTEKGINSIIVTSGIRCPTYSVKVGGFSSDAHTKGIAADIIVYDKNRTPYNSETVAAVAEVCGFTGIGIMNGATHVDIRTTGNYLNGHWFGDERNGNDNIKTFSQYLPKMAAKTNHSIKIFIDDKLIYEKEI